MRRLLVCLSLLLCCLASHAQAQPCTHYAAPNGTGNGLSQASPFQAMDFWNLPSLPGKTLCLMDGVYTGINGLVWSYGAGTASQRITVRALNDGGVLIDGEYTWQPFWIFQPYVTVQGINAGRATNPCGEVLNIGWYCVGNECTYPDYVHVKRTILWDTQGPVCNGTPCNSAIMHMANGTGMLLEDVASWGCGRKAVARQVDTNSAYRRVFALKHFDSSATFDGTDGGPTLDSAYNTVNGITENCIAGKNIEPGSFDARVFVVNPGHFCDNCDPAVCGPGCGYAGSHADTQYYMYGNIVYWKTDTMHPPPHGFQILWTPGMSGQSVPEGMTLHAYDQDALSLIRPTMEPGTLGLDFAFDDNQLGGSTGRKGRGVYITDHLTDSRGPLPSGTSNRTEVGDRNLNQFVGSDLLQITATSRPPFGAWLRYRYVDGVLQDGQEGRPGPTPLWPWPMDARIEAAMVQSGYAATRGGLDGAGELNVTRMICTMAGVSPTNCPTETVIEPQIPRNVFVSQTTGNDSVPCDNAGIATPRQTIEAGQACMTIPGSTLNLRAGTYGPLTSVVGGTDWAHPTTIQAYAGEPVTLTSSTTNVIGLSEPSQHHYILLKGLTIQQSGVDLAAVYLSGVSTVRLEGGTVTNPSGRCIASYGNTDVEILGNRLHGCTNGIRLQGNTGTLVANNLIYGNTGPGILIDTANSGLKILFNSVSANTGTGIHLVNAAPAPTTTVVTNNISFGHAVNIADDTGGAGGNTTAGNLTTDPLWVNAVAGDFHLQNETSAAVNQGSPRAEVPRDFDGIVRGTGAAGSATAPERGALDFPPPPPAARTVFVAPTGSDSVPCDSAGIGSPRQTMAAGLACLDIPSSTLYLRQGTYGRIDSSLIPAGIVGGTDWAHPTTIAAYQGEVVTVTATAGTNVVALTDSATNHFLILDTLILDGTGAGASVVYLQGVNMIRLQHSTVKNGTNCISSNSTQNIDVLGNRITGCNHALNLSVQNGGIIANNLIYGHTTDGLHMSADTQNVRFLYNSVTQNGGVGVLLLNGALGNTVQNTISYGNTGGNIQDANTPGINTLATNLETDPSWVNAAAGNFHLTAASVGALHQATPRVEVLVDFDNLLRGTGPVTSATAPDIGAYEFQQAAGGQPGRGPVPPYSTNFIIQ